MTRSCITILTYLTSSSKQRYVHTDTHMAFIQHRGACWLSRTLLKGQITPTLSKSSQDTDSHENARNRPNCDVATRLSHNSQRHRKWHRQTLLTATLPYLQKYIFSSFTESTSLSKSDLSLGGPRDGDRVTRPWRNDTAQARTHTL